MDTKVIPLRELQADPEGYLSRCCDSGEALVVELPDARRLRIQAVQPGDDLVDDLIEHDQAFQTLLAHSIASPRKAFRPLSSPDAPANG